MAELVRLQICEEIDDTWAWVALGPERQQVAVAGAPEVTEDAPVVDEGAPAVPVPVQAAQPPLATRTMAHRLVGYRRTSMAGVREDHRSDIGWRTDVPVERQLMVHDMEIMVLEAT
ncbi:hypothetical protein Tco_1321375 [Tanacetum coccineum]